MRLLPGHGHFQNEEGVAWPHSQRAPLQVPPVPKPQAGQVGEEYAETRPNPTPLFSGWPLTQFISLLPFLEKTSSGKDFSLFLPSTLSSPSRNLEGLFELTRHPSRAPIIAPTTLLC